MVIRSANPPSPAFHLIGVRLDTRSVATGHILNDSNKANATKNSPQFACSIPYQVSKYVETMQNTQWERKQFAYWNLNEETSEGNYFQFKLLITDQEVEEDSSSNLLPGIRQFVWIIRRNIGQTIDISAGQRIFKRKLVIIRKEYYDKPL